MTLQIQLIDYRFRMHEFFKWRVLFNTNLRNVNGPRRFVECQRWLAKTYGDSVEAGIFLDIVWGTQASRYQIRDSKFWENMPELSKSWTFTNSRKEFESHMLYLRSDQELAMFQLRFGG
jgi:hypothetical protein